MIASGFIGAYGTLFLVCFFFLSFFEDGLEEVNMMNTVLILGITSKCRGYAEPIIPEREGHTNILKWHD